jgi:hypothetical protein
MGELADAHMLDIGLKMVDLCEIKTRDSRKGVIVLARQQGMLYRSGEQCS